jgi:hypothetical protein
MVIVRHSSFKEVLATVRQRLHRLLQSSRLRRALSALDLGTRDQLRATRRRRAPTRIVEQKRRRAMTDRIAKRTGSLDSGRMPA